MNLPQGTEQLVQELTERIRLDFHGVLPKLQLRFIPYSEWVADDPRVAWQVKGTFRCPVGYLLGALEVFGLVE